MDPNKLIKKYHLYDGKKSFISLDELKTFCLCPGNIYIDKGVTKKDLFDPAINLEVGIRFFNSMVKSSNRPRMSLCA